MQKLKDNILILVFLYITAMGNGHLSSCRELVKGLHACEDDVKAMNLRALLANTFMREAILAETWEKILSWLDWPCSGLTDEEVLRLKATIMKVNGDSSWFDPESLGESNKM